MNRRAILALLPAIVAGCGIVSTSKTGSVGSVTLNVAKVDAWAQVVKTNVALIMALPGVGAALGVYGPSLQMVLALVAEDVKQFHAAAGDKASLTFDSGSAPAAVKSLLNDFDQILATFAAAKFSADVAEKAKPYVAAIEAVVADVQALIA